MNTIRDPEHLGSWLTTTASRECLALIRHRRWEIPDDTAGTQLLATEEEPDAAVITHETRRAVDTAVNELPERHRALILQLFYQSDASYAEVSRATGMPRGSIGLTRRRVLRDTLEQRGFGSQSGADVTESVESRRGTS